MHNLLVLTTLLIPILALMIYVGHELRDRYRDSVDNQMESTAQSLAVAIERAFQGHIGALQSFASSPDFGTAEQGGDLGRLYRHATRIADVLGTNIVVIRPDMSQVFNTLAPLGADLPKTGGSEVASRTFGVGTPQMSNLFFSRVANRYAVGLSVPVRDESGTVSLVIAAPLDPALLAEVLSRSMHGQDGFAALIDGHGRIIARSERHEEFVGADVPDWWRRATAGRERGSVIGENLEGRDVLVSYVPVAVASKWTMAVALPVSVYERYWRQPLEILQVGIAATILLSLGLSLFLARRVQRPLTALAGFALDRAAAIQRGAVSEGRFDTSPLSPVREVRQLRDSLMTFESEVVRRERQQLDLVGRLKSTINDRDVLMGEVSHRVKNNLQQIIALTVLRSSRCTTPEAKDALAFISNHVRSLAKVHQMLLQASAPSQVDPREFLESLCHTIAGAYDLDDRRIRITVDAEGVALSPDTAITLGLIANELIDNAQRHAFSNRETGEIRVFYGRHRDGRLQISVADDGTGSGDLARDELGTGLGHSIVAALAQQLKGEVMKDSSNSGTTMTVLFYAD